MDFEINFIFLIKPFLDTTEKLRQKFKTKIQIFWEREELLR